VDLNALVDEIVLEQRELLAARQIEVVVERPLPLLWCHADRLKQIVANLLGNAARHGCDPRKPRITIAARPAQSPEARMASFQIHDNGLGIEPRFRSEIFAPGWRVPGTAVEGTGMGLAIVKRMVEQYGGRVHLDSACTEGTCFVVALPAAAAESVPEATTSEEPRPAGRAWKSSRRRLNSF
jgi:signal transduction histidine kinase